MNEEFEPAEATQNDPYYTASSWQSTGLYLTIAWMNISIFTVPFTFPLQLCFISTPNPTHMHFPLETFNVSTPIFTWPIQQFMKT